MADFTELLKQEMQNLPAGEFFPGYHFACGYRESRRASAAGKRADAIHALFTRPTPYIFKNDLIAGSMRPLFVSISKEEKAEVEAALSAIPERHFLTNCDHYAPDYETVLTIGIDGMIQKIAESKKNHADEPDRLDFLDCMQITLEALSERLEAHAIVAAQLKGTEGYDDQRLAFIEQNCRRVAHLAPESFAEGLQLVWMIHSCFLYERRYAMALGRIDQYLYPLYKSDIESGRLTDDEATLLLANTFVKICERRYYFNADDVVNICIGGVDEDGNCAVNGLTYCTLYAVRDVNLPGPNLSARITPDVPDHFLDECLKVIGTGLGYPALMNDAVNMAALRRYGYEEKDVRNYSMVGCIENFITGMQPPWSDGRFDTPRFLEFLLYDGESFDKNIRGIKTAPLSEITSMDILMENLEKQLTHGVKAYVDAFHARNHIPDPENYTSPFLSCFCRDCIERGLDINMGGAHYPSVHGAGLMGIGTMSDSLAAIEDVVFINKETTLEELAKAMKANFEGYESLHERLISAPKYGNNDPFVDKYAIWFVDYLAQEFMKYKTYDGGGIYIAIAANTNNISAGFTIGATPDGRLAGRPLSDAASPSYGRDTKGATSTLLSVSKPDYSHCACGTVVNQKYSPSIFADGKRDKLLNLIKVYFARGGQEIQINATSPEILRDAMEHPENYPTLVVRVSGFSALYVTLHRVVQEDILSRTQQE